MFFGVQKLAIFVVLVFVFICHFVIICLLSLVERISLCIFLNLVLMATKLIIPKTIFLLNFRHIIWKSIKSFLLRRLFKSKTNPLVISHIAVCGTNERKLTLKIKVFYNLVKLVFLNLNFLRLSTNKDQEFTLHLFSLTENFHFFGIRFICFKHGKKALYDADPIWHIIDYL